MPSPSLARCHCFALLRVRNSHYFGECVALSLLPFRPLRLAFTSHSVSQTVPASALVSVSASALFSSTISSASASGSMSYSVLISSLAYTLLTVLSSVSASAYFCVSARVLTSGLAVAVPSVSSSVFAFSFSLRGSKRVYHFIVSASVLTSACAFSSLGVIPLSLLLACHLKSRLLL